MRFLNSDRKLGKESEELLLETCNNISNWHSIDFSKWSTIDLQYNRTIIEIIIRNKVKVKDTLVKVNGGLVYSVDVEI